MKRLIALLLALLMMAPCAYAEETPAARYEAASALMIAGDYNGAAAAFAALAGYMDAPQMAAYCQGLHYASRGDYALAVQAFTWLADFKDSAMQADLCRARDAVQQADALLNDPAKVLDLDALDQAAALLAQAQAFCAPYAWHPAALAESASSGEKLSSAQERAGEIRLAREEGRRLVVERNGVTGLMKPDGTTLLLQCGEILSVGERLIVTKTEGVVRVHGWDGAVLAEADSWSEDGCMQRTVAVDGGERILYGYANADSGVLEPCIWQDQRMLRLATSEHATGYSGVLGFGDALLAVQAGNKVRVIRWDGTLALEADRWAGGVVKLDGAQGYVDLETGLILPPDAANEEVRFANGVAIVQRGQEQALEEAKAQGLSREDRRKYAEEQTRYGAYGCGGLVLPFEYESIEVASAGLVAKQSGLWGYFTRTGEKVLPCEYEEITVTPESLIVRKDGLFGLFTLTGEMVLPCAYNWMACIRGADYTYLNLLEVWQDGQVGLLTLTGEEVLPCTYDQVEAIYSGLRVSQEGKQGFFTLKGEEVLPCAYDQVEAYYYGLWVSRDGKQGFFTLTGEEVLPCAFDQVEVSHYGLRVSRDGKRGFFTLTGEEVLPCVYEEVGWNADGLFAMRDGKCGWFTCEGAQILPCVYDAIKIPWIFSAQQGFVLAVRDGVNEWYTSEGGYLPGLTGVADVKLVTEEFAVIPQPEGGTHIVTHDGRLVAALAESGVDNVAWVQAGQRRLLQVSQGVAMIIWLDEAGGEVARISNPVQVGDGLYLHAIKETWSWYLLDVATMTSRELPALAGMRSARPSHGLICADRSTSLYHTSWFNTEGTLLVGELPRGHALEFVADGCILKDRSVPAERLLVHPGFSTSGGEVRLIALDGTVLLSGYGVMKDDRIALAENGVVTFYDLNGERIR